MSYKVTCIKDAKPYEAPGHYDMRALRLHNANDVNDGKITLGLSHFLPGGGAEFGKAPVELLYVITRGELTVKTDDETLTLKEGDSIHLGRDTGRGVENKTNYPASMLVIVVS
jgi:quercetin dioxygenase-like cupin family protein